MRYSAFLSYSRADDGVANWLHRQLDRYRTPRRLVGEPRAQGAILPKLHPIFRDRTDMAGGGRLTDRIKQALECSDRLIVLCSPAAARSLWVEQEVQTFISLHGIERVFPVVAPDLPETDDIERDYFPVSLRNGRCSRPTYARSEIPAPRRWSAMGARPAE